MVFAGAGLPSASAAARRPTDVKMTVNSVEEEEGCDLDAPRAGSCWTKTFLPRGVRVRSNLASRNVRRALKEVPAMWLAMVIAVHTTMVPITMMSMQMLQPTAELRISNDIFR